MLPTQERPNYPIYYPIFSCQKTLLATQRSVPNQEAPRHKSALEVSTLKPGSLFENYQDEVNFKFGADDDLHVVIDYEYARESKTISDRVAEIRKVKKGFQFQPRWQAVSSWLFRFDEFPSTPWTRIERGRRAKIISDYWHIFGATKRAACFLALLDEDVQNGKTLVPPDTRNWVAGEVLLNRAAYAEDIVSAFEQWVASLGVGRKPSKKGRMNAPTDALNALRALRLKFHCSDLEEAQKVLSKLNEEQQNVPFYKDRKSFERAAKRAVRMFQETLLLPNEQPVRFTQGWNRYQVSAAAGKVPKLELPSA